jgi:hypothetical protein
MGVGDGRDDREAEPVPAGSLDLLSPLPLERLEETADLARRYRRAGVRTETTARPPRVTVEISAQPPGML